MEIRIKTGKELACDYTDSEAEALVKLFNDDGIGETLWLSRKALVDALRVLDAIEGRAVAQPVQQQHHQEPRRQLLVDEVAQEEPQKKNRSRPDSPEVVKRFEKAVAELVENPPESKKNDGTLAEIHIRELIQMHKPVFNDPLGSMFPVLNRYIGMDRNRVELILSSSKG